MNESRLELEHVEGETRITRMVSRVPLRLLETGVHDGGVEVQLASYGGGVVQGDRVLLRLRCGEGTGLLLKSQANTHVYRNETGCDTLQRIDGACCSGASVCILPEPLVLHRDAVFRQEQFWALDESADMVLADWVQSGRSESNEQFLFRRYESHVEIAVGGNSILEERFVCAPGEGDVRSPAAFGPYDLMLNLYLIGPHADEEAAKLTPFLDFPQVHTDILPETRLNPCRPLVCALNPLPGGQGHIFRAMARTRRHLQPVFDRLLPCRFASARTAGTVL